MRRFKAQILAVALVAALSAFGLFHVRGELADTRASVAATKASRDHTWDNYLLSEQRGTAAAVLIVSRDSLGIAEAVLHTRGAFVAISAAADDKIPMKAASLLGANGPPHRSPFALELANNRFNAYNALKEQIAPLQNRALTKIEAHRAKIDRLKRRIRLLTHLETAAFLLTVICALLLNVLSTGRNSER